MADSYTNPNTVNDATNKADKVAQKKMKKVTGGIKIPGLF